MNLSDLTDLFGAYTPMIVLLAGIFVAGVIVVAFYQGRSISIWPPRFGPPVGADRVLPDGETSADRPLPAGGAVAVVDREYTVDRAREFYEQIAPNYDLRNSGNLVSTHLETVAQIQAIRSRKPALRVLDLGGGTGKLIAIHFFNDEMIVWTYVDFCPAMAERFRRNLVGHPLGRNAEIIVEDLTLAVRQLRPASYDVVLLSLVLSSMPTLPDFASVARLLTPGGSLIVTDISPGYTHANPLYMVPIDGAVVALRTTPVDPMEVIRRASSSGLRMVEQKPLGEGKTYYSFVTVFAPVPVRPLDEERGDESLVSI